MAPCPIRPDCIPGNRGNSFLTTKSVSFCPDVSSTVRCVSTGVPVGHRSSATVHAPGVVATRSGRVEVGRRLIGRRRSGWLRHSLSIPVTSGLALWGRVRAPMSRASAIAGRPLGGRGVRAVGPVIAMRNQCGGGERVRSVSKRCLFWLRGGMSRNGKNQRLRLFARASSCTVDDGDTRGTDCQEKRTAVLILPESPEGYGDDSPRRRPVLAPLQAISVSVVQDLARLVVPNGDRLREPVALSGRGMNTNRSYTCPSPAHRDGFPGDRRRCASGSIDEPRTRSIDGTTSIAQLSEPISVTFRSVNQRAAAMPMPAFRTR